jgi:hypothetical protein
LQPVQPQSARVYLARGATDLRKSIDGLCALVSYSFELDPMSASLFVFCNRDRDKLKILYWDNNGFWLLYRRLETGRFRWPRGTSARGTSARGTSARGTIGGGGACGEGPLLIDRRQLQWLLDGLDLEQKRAHAPLILAKNSGESGGIVIQ